MFRSQLATSIPATVTIPQATRNPKLETQNPKLETQNQKDGKIGRG